jgi:hypothetical protein
MSVGSGNVSKRPILSTLFSFECLRDDCERNIQRFQTCFRCNNKVAELSLSHEADRSYSLLYGEFLSGTDGRVGMMTSKQMLNIQKWQLKIADIRDQWRMLNMPGDVLKSY